MTDLAAAALIYARLGLPVFPIWPPVVKFSGGFMCGCGRLDCDSPAKHPHGRIARNGLKDATHDEARVRWFWQARADCNIGIATGTVIVLDIDPRHGGGPALAELESKHGALAATWRVATGGGGEHIYFAADTEKIANSTNKLGQGIDVRGVGGYVVAPPSRHISGKSYTWITAPDEASLAQMPCWLVTELKQPATNKQTTLPEAWQKLVREGVSEGKRNDAVARLAGHLLQRDVDAFVVLDLCQVWNAARCRPPLSAAEVLRTVNSIAGRELKKRESA